MEHNVRPTSPWKDVFVGQGPQDTRPQPTSNMLVKHGVRSCLEYAKSGDIQKARQLSNPDLAPHVAFVDSGGHGYAVVHATASNLETEFVCIPRPVVRHEQPDGGPLVYRVRHSADIWRKDERPKLKQVIVDGNPEFSI